jgi:hypothetical protein
LKNSEHARIEIGKKKRKQTRGSVDTYVLTRRSSAVVPEKSRYRISADGVIIEHMGGPFRFNKKTRKRLRRFAKKVATTADKFETEGTKPIGVATLRFLAESNIARAKARKKKKPKSPK